MDAAAAITRLERAEGLDRAAAVGRKAVQRLAVGRVKDALHGVWLGHPLHPMLAQVALGSFLSAGVLDTDAQPDGAARRLIATGLVASLPAAASGAVDWAESHEQQQRVGLVHAAANTVALGAYVASLAARAAGRQGLGRALAFAGLAAAGGSGYLGGHLAFRQATGANHTEDVPHLVKPGWHSLGAVVELTDPEPVRRLLGDIPVLIHRQGDRWHVLADRCPHLSAPLSEGDIDDGCVTCPWHGSKFRLADGSVVRGPATAPVPCFDSRVRDGDLEVRLPGAG